jgi:hypothetical protein
MTEAIGGAPPDMRLVGVWSREHVRGVAARTSDVRLIFMPDHTGRYETWSAELTEVITFGWSVDPPSRLTMLGREYVFRDEAKHVRREPCDWHFPNVPFDISVEPVAAGGAMPLLRLHFPLGRVDTYGLVTPDLTGYEDFHFA